MLVADRLGPHRAERAAQPGGELLAPLDHLRGGDAVGQVDLGPPAGPVLADRRRERRDRLPVGERPVDLGDAQRAERPDDDVLVRRLHLRGQLGLVVIVLPCGRPGQRERHEQRDGGERPRPTTARTPPWPRRRRPGRPGTAPGSCRAPCGSPCPALWIRRWSFSSPSAAAWRSSCAVPGMCHQAISRLTVTMTRPAPRTRRLGEVRRRPHAVVRGPVPVPRGGQRDVPLRASRVASAAGMSGRRCALAAGQVDVRRAPAAWSSSRLYLGGRLGGAQRYDVSAAGGRVGRLQMSCWIPPSGGEPGPGAAVEAMHPGRVLTGYVRVRRSVRLYLAGPCGWPTWSPERIRRMPGTSPGSRSAANSSASAGCSPDPFRCTPGTAGTPASPVVTQRTTQQLVRADQASAGQAATAAPSTPYARPGEHVGEQRGADPGGQQPPGQPRRLHVAAGRVEQHHRRGVDQPVDRARVQPGQHAVLTVSRNTS